MKIAILAGSLSRGGTERVIVKLAEYFVSQGDETVLVTSLKADDEYEISDKVKRIISDLDEHEVTSSRIGNFKARFLKLQNIWVNESPDVILSFIGKNNFMALLTAQKLGIPVITAVRGMPEEEYYTTWMKVLAKILFKKASKCVFQTTDQRDFFPPKVRKNSVILKNPIDSSFLSEPVPFDQRENIIVCVGRVDENKDHKLVIDAFSNIAADFPDWKLIIYGEGNMRNSLLELAKTRNLADRILLPGRITDVYEKIKIARVFVLSSKTEGMPNSLIESMCQGLACIATDCPCGGPKDLITPNVNGLLIPVGDMTKMQDSLQKLLNNLQQIERIGSEALKTRGIYQEEAVLNEWYDLLTNTVKSRKFDR